MSQMNLQFDGYPAGCVMTVSIDGVPKYKLLQAVTPIADGETTMHMVIAIYKRAGWTRRLADLVLYGMQTRVAASYDVAIWNQMNAEAGGAYSKYDRLVLKYRSFYRSWVDRVEADGENALRSGEARALTLKQRERARRTKLDIDHRTGKSGA